MSDVIQLTTNRRAVAGTGSNPSRLRHLYVHNPSYVLYTSNLCLDSEQAQTLGLSY